MKKAFIGSDASKGYMNVHITNEKGEVLKSKKKYIDNFKDHTALAKQVDKLKKDGYEEIYFAIESTGGYENNWVRSTLKMGCKVYRLNPKRTHYQGKLEMIRTENDEVSATLICSHLRVNYQKLTAVGENAEMLTNCRKLYNDINTTQKHRVQLSNQLQQIIYSLMPELQRYVKEKFPTWLLELLIKYPSSSKIKRAKALTISKIKNITLDKAKEIQSVLENGIGLEEDASMEYLIVKNCRKIKDLIADEKASKEFLESVFEHEQKSLLTQINGIGDYTASVILLEIEDISRFSSSKKMVSFFGVHPNHKESGDKKTKSKMSKRGSSTYRSIIFMGAKNVVLHNEEFRELYKKLMATGRKYLDVMGIIMHKLTRIIYGILKNNNSYNPQKVVGQKIEMSTEKKLQKAKTKKAKIQKEIDNLLKAPCSKKKIRTKTKELESQDKLIAEYGII